MTTNYREDPSPAAPPKPMRRWYKLLQCALLGSALAAVGWAVSHHVSKPPGPCITRWVTINDGNTVSDHVQCTHPEHRISGRPLYGLGCVCQEKTP